MGFGFFVGYFFVIFRFFVRLEGFMRVLRVRVLPLQVLFSQVRNIRNFMTLVSFWTFVLPSLCIIALITLMIPILRPSFCFKDVYNISGHYERVSSSITGI